MYFSGILLKTISCNKKMTNNIPSISVIMPVFNNREFVREAVKSVLDQTIPDFEFIIIDDASTDGTSDILNKYKSRDKRIKVVRNKKNQGLTKSLNIGLRHAQGEYIARMDGDDICVKKRLEKQLNYMKNYPGCDFLATRAIVINNLGKYIKKTKNCPSGQNIKQYLLDTGNPFIHSSMMFRRKTIEELGGYNELWPTRQDYELYLRAAFAGKQFACLKQPLLYFRFHSDSLSVSKPENLLTNLLLRGYYRAKQKGREVNPSELRKKLAKSSVIKEYAKYVSKRRAMKHLLGNIRSLNIKRTVKNFLYVIKLPKTFINPKKINSVLDELSAEKQGYSEKQALAYDKKRFSSSQGKLFNELEKENLNNALTYIPQTANILEIGCGTGRFALETLNKGFDKVHCIDLSFPMLKETKSKVRNTDNIALFQSEGGKLPFKDNSFDFVYAIRVLNQLGSKNYALNVIGEAIRVCGKEGFILLEFINCRSLSIRRRPCVRFSVAEIRKILNKYDSIRLLKISGVLFFTQTILGHIPPRFLGFYEKTEKLFAKIFPQFCTRCYIFLKKT